MQGKSPDDTRKCSHAALLSDDDSHHQTPDANLLLISFTEVLVVIVIYRKSDLHIYNDYPQHPRKSVPLVTSHHLTVLELCIPAQYFGKARNSSGPRMVLMATRIFHEVCTIHLCVYVMCSPLRYELQGCLQVERLQKECRKYTFKIVDLMMI
ncbi:hypothetical protein EMCRGX_G001231 [Ephydatia muelleri]